MPVKNQYVYSSKTVSKSNSDENCAIQKSVKFATRLFLFLSSEQQRGKHLKKKKS